MKKLVLFVAVLIATLNIQAQIIVVDPGHGYGATTSDNPDGRTATEIETALEVGLRTRNLIQASCTWTVYMTRTTNLNSWISVTQRATMANNWNADRILSIHCNAGGGTGTETFYCTQDDTNTAPDIAFAQKIQTDMTTNGQWNNRRCVEDNSFLAYHLGVLRYSSATGCLNEIGFVDSSDATKLTSSTWRDTFALSYFNSLKSNLNQTCATTPAPGTFTLTATPECNGTTTQVKLTWTASSNATFYDLYRNGIVYAAGLTGTTYTNTAVTTGTAYSYYVKAKNAGATQTTNSNGTLNVTALNCSLPGSFSLTATPDCNGTTSRVSLSWTAATNATSYDLYRNGTVYAANLTGTTYSNTAVTAGTTYTYYVKAKNANGATNNSNGTLSVTAVNCSAPGAFTLSAVAECNANVSRVNLTWTVAANATSYDIYRNGSLYASDVTGTQFLNTYITPGTTYSYSITAKNTIGSTNNSNGTLTVTAITCPPGAFTLTASPTCSGTTSAINLTWTASPNATSYDIYRNGNLYATDVTSTSFLNTYLITAGTAYTYYVKAKNSVGALNNSNGTQSVTATNCTAKNSNVVKEEELSIINLVLYPNPTDGIFTVETNQLTVNSIQFMLFDLSGRLIKEGVLNEDKSINITNLPSSTYLIRLICGEKEFVKQIVKK